jgi:hypothetical protein
MRTFPSGATKSDDVGKIDYEGILSPLVLERFGEYMRKHTVQVDGTLRTSDNWQRGIPLQEYLKSGLRHVMDWWKIHRNIELYSRAELEDALCAVMFNAMGYLHALLKERYPVPEPLVAMNECGPYPEESNPRRLTGAGSPLPPEAGYIHTNKRSE